MIRAFWLLISLSLASAAAQATEFLAVTPQIGAAALTAKDEFLGALTPSDLSIRLHKDRGTARDLQTLYAASTLVWTADEFVRLTQAIERHRAQLDELSGLLPSTVQIAKTSVGVDGGLPHTRGNTVFMGPSLPASDKTLDFILLHEIFHVLSRQNAARHDELYGLVGFEPCKTLGLPRKLREQMITNPDAPSVLHVVATENGGLLTPVLFAEPPKFNPKQPAFEDYFALHYVVVQRDPLGACSVSVDNGKPREVEQQAAMEAIFKKAGRNTPYLFHPEEILADNFAQLLMNSAGAPDPWVYDKLASWLGYVRVFNPPSN